jgi:hypothetical protein
MLKSLRSQTDTIRREFNGNSTGRQWNPEKEEPHMSDLNNASNPTPPADARAKLAKAEEESRKLDSPTRTNDSTIDPDKPLTDILEGYHGG